MNIVIDNTGSLVQMKWTFIVRELQGDPCIVLDRYTEAARPSKRHAFRVQRSYARLSHEAREIDGVMRLSEEDVPLPPDVIRRAMDTYIATVRVGLWRKDFGRK